MAYTKIKCENCGAVIETDTSSKICIGCKKPLKIDKRSKKKTKKK